MNKPPSFQFYADDFIGGTAILSNAERGIYIVLLCHQWNLGGLPDDIERLKILTRTNEPKDEAALRYVLASKFVKGDDGLLRNARLEMVRANSQGWTEKSQKGGKASAIKRVGNSEWGKKMASLRQGNEPSNEPSNEPTTNSPSPSPNKHDIERVFAERPSLEEVKAYAAQIGLGTWKAEDWFNEMEACGWLDFNHRPVAKWQPMLVRVKTKWEADGRPTAPPSAKASQSPNGAQRGPFYKETPSEADLLVRKFKREGLIPKDL